MTYSIYWLLPAVLVVLLFFSPSLKSKSSLPRLGKDLGLLNLRIWLARIDFLRNGQKLVEDSYLRVCDRFDPSHKRQLT